MKLKDRGKLIVAGMAAGLLIGGGLATFTPAGAVVEQAAAAVNWQNIWKTEIKPRADRRYYTKVKSDARYAPYPKRVRGVIGNVGDVDSGGDAVGTGYSFGVAFGTAPTAHIIEPGDPLPSGCLGTPAAPDALPGHLCIFPNVYQNVGSDTVCSATNNCVGASRFGFFYIAFSAASGTLDVTGSWAARPAGGVTANRTAHPRGSAPTGSSGASGR